MPTLWMDRAINDDVTIGTQGNLDLLTGLGEPESRMARFTLTRTIIGLDIARTVHDSGEGSELISLGIQIVSRPSFESPGSIPSPQDQTEFPARGWVWRASYRVFGFAADQPAIFTRRIDLDIRSQRKLENGVSVLSLQALAVEGANSTARVSGFIRQLWLTP